MNGISFDQIEETLKHELLEQGHGDLYAFWLSIKGEPKRWRFGPHFAAVGGSWVLGTLPGLALAYDEFEEEYCLIEFEEDGVLLERSPLYCYGSAREALRALRQCGARDTEVPLERWGLETAWRIALARNAWQDFQGRDWIRLAERSVAFGDVPREVLWLAGEVVDPGETELRAAVDRAVHALGLGRPVPEDAADWVWTYYGSRVLLDGLDPLWMVQYVAHGLGLAHDRSGYVFRSFATECELWSVQIRTDQAAAQVSAKAGAAIRQACRDWLRSQGFPSLVDQEQSD